MFKSTLMFLGAPFAERPNDKKSARNKNKMSNKKLGRVKEDTKKWSVMNILW